MLQSSISRVLGLVPLNFHSVPRQRAAHQMRRLAKRFATVTASGTMSASSCETQQHLLNSGCIEGVLQTLKEHGNKAVVAEVCFQIFKNMGAGSVEGKKRLLKSGCTAAVQKVVAAHGDNTAVSDSWMFGGSTLKLRLVFYGRSLICSHPMGRSVMEINRE